MGTLGSNDTPTAYPSRSQFGSNRRTANARSQHITATNIKILHLADACSKTVPRAKLSDICMNALVQLFPSDKQLTDMLPQRLLAQDVKRSLTSRGRSQCGKHRAWSSSVHHVKWQTTVRSTIGGVQGPLNCGDNINPVRHE